VGALSEVLGGARRSRQPARRNSHGVLRARRNRRGSPSIAAILVPRAAVAVSRQTGSRSRAGGDVAHSAGFVTGVL